MPEHEHKGEHTEHKEKKFRLYRQTIIASIVCIIIGFVAASFVFSISKTTFITADQASERAENFINNLLQGQASAKITNVTEAGGLYRFEIVVDGRKFDSFMSKDGRFLFPNVYDLEEISKQPVQQQQQSEMPKTDKPKVELFVMSFCPYGIEAEKALKPVVDLLGGKIDTRIRFIASAGDTVDSVQSLHGSAEAKEDLRQLCVQKNYPDKFWKYLMYIAGKYPNEINTNNIESKWKDAANETGINTASIESCVSSDGLIMLKADEQFAGQYGVGGSPTLIINGATYNGARTPEAFKQAVCSAFTTQPPECTQTLTETAQTTAGSCG